MVAGADVRESQHLVVIASKTCADVSKLMIIGGHGRWRQCIVGASKHLHGRSVICGRTSPGMQVRRGVEHQKGVSKRSVQGTSITKILYSTTSKNQGPGNSPASPSVKTRNLGKIK